MQKSTRWPNEALFQKKMYSIICAEVNRAVLIRNDSGTESKKLRFRIIRNDDVR